MSLDAMKQALDALNDCTYDEEGYCLNPDNVDAILALRAAIEQAQEPVAWVGPSWLNPETRTWESESFAPRPIKGWISLYTAPRQWQGLTEDEKNAMVEWAHPDIIEAIELKLRERNT